MRALVAAAAIVPISFAQGQCDVSVFLEAEKDCGGLMVDLSITGGTGPYSYSLEAASALWNWEVVFATGNVLGPNTYAMFPPQQGFPWLGPTFALRVTVTDVNGCWAESNSAFVPVMVFDPIGNLTSSADCGTGLSFLEVVFAGVGGGYPTYAPPTYTLDPLGGGNFATDWTLVTGSTWRYNAPAPAGTYTLQVPGHEEGGVSHCPDVLGSTVVDPGLTPGDCGVNFNLRAALNGPLPSGTLMNDGLRTANLLPTTQPYTALGYTFVGSPTNVGMASGLMSVTGNDAIVDWVVVELRSSATSVAFSKPALLQRDGDVIDTDGDTYLNFPVPAGPYYVVLRHRNHLGVMTATTRSLSEDPGTAMIDFTLGSTPTYGTNARTAVGPVQCLWPGDANGDGTAQYTGTNNDRDLILQAIGGSAPTNTVSNVYDRRDINMDGTLRYTGTDNDRDLILQAIGGNVPTAVRHAQLP